MRTQKRREANQSNHRCQRSSAGPSVVRPGARPDREPIMKKFSHIEAFYKVIRTVRTAPEGASVAQVGTVRYRGTVKLHGSNAGVRCTNESLVAQSRTRALSPDDDNYGFAAFVHREDVSAAIREIEADVRAKIDGEVDALTLYGEWVGPGIQKGVATCLLPTKQWVLFAVRDDSGRYYDALSPLADRFAPLGIHSVFDVPTYTLEVDYRDDESLAEGLDVATKKTLEVEAACPWGARFDIEGVGEGIVWMPLDAHFGISDLFFKTKGEKHQKVKSKSSKPKLTPEEIESIEAFVTFALPESRLEQGLEAIEEAGYSIEMRSMPHFLRWIGQDVKRECSAELEANELEWKVVQKAIARRAREYFRSCAERLPGE